MIEVKLTHPQPHWPFLRQTPGRVGIWGDYRFHYNTDIDECDYWIVYSDVPQAITTICPPERTLLYVAEPPSVLKFSNAYCAQFASIVTCQRQISHPHPFYVQQAQPWFIGGRFDDVSCSWGEEWTKDYDELKAMTMPEKDRLLSCFCSSKTMTEGHRRRLHFVDSLASKLATPLDTFGVGIRNLPDKWDGLAPYKYSIAIENTSEPDYWTEKLSDALLSYCHVFYWGCPNIASYLPSQSMTWIDINDVDAAVATIEATIAANAFETSREAVAKARGLILDKYNLFPFSIDLFGKLPTPTRPRPITIRSKRVMEPISNRLMGRARGLVRDIGRLASR